MRLLATIIVSLIAVSSPAAQFRGITAGDIAAGFSYQMFNPIVSVSTISGDGSTIAGTVTQTGLIFDCASFDCANAAFVWSIADSSSRPLGELPLNSRTRAYPKSVPALSFDGSTALVTYEYRHYESALYRTDSDTVATLRDPIALGEWLQAADIVPDASVVVGTLGDAPFRWSQTDGFEGFLGLGPGAGYVPSAISADGSTTIFSEPIVIDDRVPGIGLGPVREPLRNAYRWTLNHGASELLPLDGFTFSHAADVSTNGAISVGTSISSVAIASVPRRATLWIDSQSFPLEMISEYSAASAVSGDGSVIVGTAGTLSSLTDSSVSTDAVLWRDGAGLVLKDLLKNEYGLGSVLEGWRLTSATAISDDGRVIAGQGIAPDGSSSAWMATLTVPEPKNGIPAAIALLAFAGITRRRDWKQSR